MYDSVTTPLAASSCGVQTSLKRPSVAVLTTGAARVAAMVAEAAMIFSILKKRRCWKVVCQAERRSSARLRSGVS